MNDVLKRFYPEKFVSGFTRDDYRVTFFTQVNALLQPHMRVLDFGAGRGKWAERESGYKGSLTTLRGKCAEIVGSDVDEAVLENPQVDRAVVTDPAKPLPFEDGYFDIIVSWATFEHIANPDFAASELSRVLKPGGWICAWTPSKWSYFAIAARLVPNRHHANIVHRLAGMSHAKKDVFPTQYKLNTLGALRRHFQGFDSFSFYFNGSPAYHGNILPLAMTWRLWMALLPKPFSMCLYVFLKKRDVT